MDNYTTEKIVKEFIDDIKQNRPKIIVDTLFWSDVGLLKNEIVAPISNLHPELQEEFIKFVAKNYLFVKEFSNTKWRVWVLNV